MRRKARGFSLAELLIALTLSVFVMIGIISVSTSMVRYQFEGIRKGQVTGYTLYSLAQMNRELENATHLELPSVSLPTSNALSGCSNWSANMTPLPAQIDAGSPVQSFYYCVDSNNSLLRYAGGACPPPQPGSCGAGVGGMTMGTVVYRNFYHNDCCPAYFFRRSNDVAGIELHYIIGISTPYADAQKSPIPVYYKFDTRIGMNKSYNNTLD